MSKKKSMKMITEQLMPGEEMIASMSVVSGGGGAKSAGMLAVTNRQVIYASSVAGIKRVDNHMLSQIGAVSVSKDLLQARITITIPAGSSTYLAKYKQAEEVAATIRHAVSAHQDREGVRS